MHSTPQPQETLYSLQIGRALAALAVVVHHAAGAASLSSGGEGALALQLLGLGYLGVDYFFVLSGFIIAYSTLAGPQDGAAASHYCTARLSRIFLPYLPVAMGLLVLFALVPALGAHMEYSVFASLTLLPSNELPVLSVAWSLQHELVFYVLFGLCAFALKRPRLIFLWAVPIAILPWLVFPRWGNVVAGFFNLEFLFGVAVYYLYRAGWGYAARRWLLAAGIVTLVMAGGVLLAGAIPHYYRVVAGLGFACIVLALVHYECTVDFRRARGLVFLGAASYAIYLVHAPFLSALLTFLPVTAHWTLLFVAFVLLACAAGVAYHLIVEKPLLRWFRARIA